MGRASKLVKAERINAALALLRKSESLAEAATALVRTYGMSKRQAYRYLQAAQHSRGPVPVPERKMTFTVKLSEGLIQQLRQQATLTGQSLSELVGQALEAFLPKRQRRGR
jgi:predicted DNA-binding transcriptional regulator YafY